MKKICIIEGHPDNLKKHFCHALADEYEIGAKSEGHEVVRINVADLEFDALKSEEEYREGFIPDEISKSQKIILSSNHIVIIYPLWLGGMPSKLVAFFEQLMRPNFAYDADNMFDKKLKGKSAHLIVTMGMPAIIYKIFYGSHSIKGFITGVLKFVGISPVKTTFIGEVASKRTNHKKWLEKANEFGKNKPKLLGIF